MFAPTRSHGEFVFWFVSLAYCRGRNVARTSGEAKKERDQGVHMCANIHQTITNLSINVATLKYSENNLVCMENELPAATSTISLLRPEVSEASEDATV